MSDPITLGPTRAGQEAIARVLSTAMGYVDFTELPANTNRGQVVEACLRDVGLSAGDPWCAAFVYRAGYRALVSVDLTTLKRIGHWPLPATGGCAVLGEFATKHKVLESAPQAGDVFLKWHALKNAKGQITERRFAHTGFVLAVRQDGTCVTIEGNTSKPGDTDPKTAREGWGCFVKTQRWAAEDRFVRWTNLL